jgi:hypothetical protein
MILEGKQVAVVRNVDFAPRFMHSPALPASILAAASEMVDYIWNEVVSDVGEKNHSDL